MYQSGDVLKIDCSGFSHYGIYVGDDTVIHNSKALRKVEETPLKEFSKGKTISLSSITSTNRDVTVYNARKYLGLQYELFSDNCEHFVRMSCGLIKESTQVQKYLISALGVGVLLKSENNVVKAAGGAAAVASLLTPEESSPVKSAVVLACLAAGVAYLASK